MKPFVIAEICHEANRALTRYLQDVPVQPAWSDASQEMQKSCQSGVEWRLKNLDAPASAQHEEWCRAKRLDGWTYGEKRDDAMRWHPALVPYEDLSEGVKSKDALFTAIVRALAPNVTTGLYGWLKDRRFKVLEGSSQSLSTWISIEDPLILYAECKRLKFLLESELSVCVESAEVSGMISVRGSYDAASEQALIHLTGMSDSLIDLVNNK